MYLIFARLCCLKSISSANVSFLIAFKIMLSCCLFSSRPSMASTENTLHNICSKVVVSSVPFIFYLFLIYGLVCVLSNVEERQCKSFEFSVKATIFLEYIICNINLSICLINKSVLVKLLGNCVSFKALKHLFVNQYKCECLITKLGSGTELLVGM